MHQQAQAVAQVSEYTTALQTDLKATGYYKGPIDGIYGPETVDAVKQLQNDSGLPATGLVDQATALALDKKLAAVNAATATQSLTQTSAVQTVLKLTGYWTGPIDGKWTPELTDALKQFQTALGVPPTGSVDAATLAAFEQALAKLHIAAHHHDHRTPRHGRTRHTDHRDDHHHGRQCHQHHLRRPGRGRRIAPERRRHTGGPGDGGRSVARANDVALWSAVARAFTSATSASDGGFGVNAIASSAPCNERIGSCSPASAALDVSSGADVMSCSTIVMSTASRLASAPATEPKPPGASPTRCVVISSDWASTSTVAAVGAAGAGDGAAFGDRRTRAITPITAAASRERPQQPGPPRPLPSSVAAAACVVSGPGPVPPTPRRSAPPWARRASVASVGASVAGGRPSRQGSSA